MYFGEVGSSVTCAVNASELTSTAHWLLEPILTSVAAGCRQLSSTHTAPMRMVADAYVKKLTDECDRKAT